MSIAYVQGANTQASGAYGNIAVSLTGVGSGHCLVVSVGFSRNFTTNHVLLSVSDNQGNIYSPPITSNVQVDAVHNRCYQLMTFVALNITGGSVNVSINNSGLLGGYAVTVDEYSGVATVSAIRNSIFNSTVFGSAVTSVASGNVAALTGDLLYSATYDDNSPETFTPSAGFTQREAVTGTSVNNTSMDVWDKSVGSNGNYSNSTSVGSAPDTMHTVLLVLSPTTVAQTPLVQCNANDTSAIVNQSISCPFQLSNTAGNLLIVAAWMYERTNATIADSLGNTWNVVYSNSGGADDIVMGYALNCKAGANVVTMTTHAGGTDNALMMIVAEYQAASAFTANSASGIQTGASSADTGMIAASAASNLLVSACYVIKDSPPPMSQLETFRYQFSDSGFFQGQTNSLALADTIVTPGSYHNIFTQSLSGQMDAAILGFTIGGGGGGGATGGCSSGFAPCGSMPTLEVTRDLDADWDDKSTFYITQSDPFPFTLRGIVFRLSYDPD